jgi:hypothetical protein
MTKSVHPSPLRIALKDHLHKSLQLATALARAGHRLSMEGHADVLLIDAEVPKYGYRELIDYYKDMGATVLLYPHGGGIPQTEYDGHSEPYERVDGNLVNGPGHAEVLRRLGYPTPSHVIGWSLCEMRPFRPAADVRHIVFAPTHPSGHDGWLHRDWRAENAEVYARLLHGPWKLTVRHIDTLENNGLWHDERVTFVRGDMSPATAEIDVVDAVVAAEGTFPSLAVARGVPMVIYGQGRPGLYGIPGEEPVPLSNPGDYVGYSRYPFDVFDGPLDEVVHAAARSDAPIASWKRRFIGEQLDEATFAAQIERLVRQGPPPPVIEETRGFTIAGFADEVLERPELLATYASTFGPDDDVTLVLWGPGLEGDAVLDTVMQAAARGGVDPETLPDVLLLGLPGSADADRRLAERADAVLSDWPRGRGELDRLPRFGAEDDAQLRAAALAPIHT